MYKKFLDRSYQNDMQFTSFERVIRVLGKQGVYFKRVRPEDIWGTFDIVTYGPTNFENKVQKVNKPQPNFFAIAAKAPQFFNIPALQRRFMSIWKSGHSMKLMESLYHRPTNRKGTVEAENTALALASRVSS